MKVTDFRFLSDLHLVRYMDQKDGKLFYLSQDYYAEFKLDGQMVLYKVPKDTPTDGPSIPTCVPRWIVDKIGFHFEASVVHDHMCIIRGPYPSKIAAKIFRAGMRAKGVAEDDVIECYLAVRRFGPQWD